jgi:hypothetical protein
LARLTYTSQAREFGAPPVLLLRHDEAVKRLPSSYSSHRRGRCQAIDQTEFAGKAGYFVLGQRLGPPVDCVVVRNEKWNEEQVFEFEFEFEK